MRKIEKFLIDLNNLLTNTLTGGLFIHKTLTGAAGDRQIWVWLVRKMCVRNEAVGGGGGWKMGAWSLEHNQPKPKLPTGVRKGNALGVQQFNQRGTFRRWRRFGVDYTKKAKKRSNATEWMGWMQRMGRMGMIGLENSWVVLFGQEHRSADGSGAWLADSTVRCCTRLLFSFLSLDFQKAHELLGGICFFWFWFNLYFYH